MQKQIILRNDQHCFHAIAGLISTQVAFGMSLALYQQRGVSSLLRDDKCQYEGNADTTGITLEFHVRELMLKLGDGSWPDCLHLDAYLQPRRSGPMSDPWEVKAAFHIGVWQGLSSFVSFYASIEDFARTIHGGDCSSWPDLLNFARCIRNGLAHGNAIDIRNPGSPDYTWRRRTIGPSENGKSILYDMVAFADLMLLMMDVSDHISAQQGGAPDTLTGAGDL